MTCDSVFISDVGNGSLTWWDGSRLTQDQHTCFWPLSLNDIRKVVLIAADLISALSVQMCVCAVYMQVCTLSAQYDFRSGHFYSPLPWE